ncbi:peptidase inhibitor I9 [Motilibacter peucedani]|uniref:Peptidase inhibitor I9 n=1 Tax=Motilibacter peucedani TaxID=598650 RepID=A0A420XR05_9ACTN|nr:S8 family serine peptidase [Motilibacter peucedani]RKS75675.1 peptidase inhibitor I9 [Motilibacter peucedani]
MPCRPLLAAACISLFAAALPAAPASAGPIAPAASEASRNVVVVLRDQHAELPASGASLAPRVARTTADQRTLVDAATRAGATQVRQLHVANAFAARVSGEEAARLAADPGVAAVVPDRLVAAPARSTQETPAASPAVPGPVSGRACPANPSKPGLEPEALQLTHTAFADGTTPSAAATATGKGVKVAFLAEGLDVANPEFVRPDGRPVFVDYQDFSGEGLSAPTSGGEAFGDASSIAAQGRRTYDLSRFASAAHPLPAKCTIRVRGVAPDAQLVGLKVFPANGYAFSSAILAALDYAVTVDHVDIVSESFGSNQFPDTGDDPTALFNEQLVAAGVTVVASTGDSGSANTIGSPSSSPGVIAVGATTQFRTYSQLGYHGFPLSNGKYRSNGISGLSSSGITQSGRTIDLVAPGDLGWSACTADPELYADCTDLEGRPSNLQLFGGTSESAPLTAGAAALVVQAFRDSHGGASPTPAQVRQVLTSTADDLGLPADEQGAGLLDTLRAVRAARALPGSTAASASTDLVVSPTQVSVEAESGTAAHVSVTVTNVSSSTRTLRARVRSAGAVVGTPQTQSVALDASESAPAFLDATGAPRPYATATFTVPTGAQRLSAEIAYPGASVLGSVFVTLLEPDGTFAAHSLPQGNDDYGYVDVPHPVAGTWKAVVFTTSNGDGYSGPVELTTTAFAEDVDAAVPAPVTIAPGRSAQLALDVPQPHDAGDRADALVLSSTTVTGGMPSSSVVPVVLRTLLRLHAHRARVDGVLTGTNGRAGVPSPSLTYAFDVPPATESLAAHVSVPQLAGQRLYGFLVDPAGEPVSVQTNQRLDGDGTVLLSPSFDLTHVAPLAGRWQLVLASYRSSSHTTRETPFRVDLDLDAARVRATGVPGSASTVLKRGKAVHASLRFTNGGGANAYFFADPRLDTVVDQPLVVANDYWSAYGAPQGPFPAVSVPTQTTALTVSAQSSAPLLFEVAPFPADHLEDLAFQGDPDRVAGPVGTAPSVTVEDPEVAPQTWLALPSPVGPVPAEGSGEIDAVFSASARTKAFDLSVTSSTGDAQLSKVDAGADIPSLLDVAAGGTGAVELTFTPDAPVGTVVHGTVYLDALDILTGGVDEVTAVPYTYTVG